MHETANVPKQRDGVVIVVSESARVGNVPTPTVVE
jgi:hypothetical protein